MSESKSTHRTGTTHPERKPQRRLRRTVCREQSWNVRFESADTAVPAGLVKRSPTLLVAAVEEVCWQVATQDWLSRRPHRWHRRAYAAWRAQSEWLDQKRLRLGAMVGDALTAS